MKRKVITAISLITVVAGLLMMGAPAVAAPAVELRYGDGRSYADGPQTVNVANTQYSPPTVFNITTSPGFIWRYYGWIALMEPGSWIQAVTTSPTTCVGVQFWGDQNDGWARVLVDGVQVWTGDTYGPSGNWPGTAFVRYLQISGLTLDNHTVRVEHTGQAGAGGGTDVCIYFFGWGQKSLVPSVTVTVNATDQMGTVLQVPIMWSKTGGLPPNSGTNITQFTIPNVGGNVTLIAPLFVKNLSLLTFRVFTQWFVGGVPQAPGQMQITIPDVTSSKVATARYLLITHLGSWDRMPPRDYNQVGTDHTPRIRVPLPPVPPSGGYPSVNVTFARDIGVDMNPANDVRLGWGVNDTEGWATMVAPYTSNEARVDHIYAYIDVNNNLNWDVGEPRSVADFIKFWLNPGPVIPFRAFNEPGVAHTVSVNVGLPIPNIPVTFRRLFSQPTDVFPPPPPTDIFIGTNITDANGIASVTYTSYVAGMDDVYAFVDASGDEHYQFGEPRSPLPPVMDGLKYWLENFVTGGGHVKDAKGRPAYSFSGNVGMLGSEIVGEFQIVDHKNKVSYHTDNFTFLNFMGPEAESPVASNNLAVFHGIFTNNKDESLVKLFVILQDFGEPGNEDTAIIRVLNPDGSVGDPWVGTPGNPYNLTVPQVIDGGNIQIHNAELPPPPPPPAPGRIVIVKQTDPAGASGFPVTMSYGYQVAYPNGVQMSDDFQVDSGFILAPGTYVITEWFTPGWTLTSIVIDDPSGGSSSVEGTAIISLAPGETVTVTYNNTKNS